MFEPHQIIAEVAKGVIGFTRGMVFNREVPKATKEMMLDRCFELIDRMIEAMPEDEPRRRYGA